MSFFKKLLGKDGGIIDQVTGIVDKAVTDKDARNQMIYEISLLMMSSKIAPYIRGIIGITIVVSVMFFGDSVTLSEEGQKYALYSVLGYYFLDRVFSSFGAGKKK